MTTVSKSKGFSLSWTSLVPTCNYCFVRKYSRSQRSAVEQIHVKSALYLNIPLKFCFADPLNPLASNLRNAIYSFDFVFSE